MSAQIQSPLLRLPSVMAAVGLGKSSIYQLEKDGKFPAKICISRRAVAWRADQIEAWIAAREVKNVAVPEPTNSNESAS